MYPFSKCEPRQVRPGCVRGCEMRILLATKSHTTFTPELRVRGGVRACLGDWCRKEISVHVWELSFRYAVSFLIIFILGLSLLTCWGFQWKVQAEISILVGVPPPKTIKYCPQNVSKNQFEIPKFRHIFTIVSRFCKWVTRKYIFHDKHGVCSRK